MNGAVSGAIGLDCLSAALSSSSSSTQLTVLAARIAIAPALDGGSHREERVIWVPDIMAGRGQRYSFSTRVASTRLYERSGGALHRVDAVTFVRD